MTAPAQAVLPIRARIVRAIRRAVGLDRERYWNAAYASGKWAWLHNIDELAHHCVLAGYFAYLKKDGTVLDVGCGDGVFREQLRDCYSRYVGVDFAEPIRQALAKAEDGLDPRIVFVEGDMNEFVPAERFDAIVFNESAYYFNDVLAGLKRYEAFLRPEGVFLVSMHGKERNEKHWERIDAHYQVLDEVTVRNKKGVTWTVKAFVPPVHH